jgi:hypothetical protein
MKTKRIDLRASEEVNDRFESNAVVLGHTRSSLLVVLMESLNRHMAKHGKIIFPIEFADSEETRDTPQTFIPYEKRKAEDDMPKEVLESHAKKVTEKSIQSTATAAARAAKAGGSSKQQKRTA